MLQTTLGYLLWLAAPMFQLAILVFMVRQKLRQQFPFFFNYTILQVLTAVVLFAVYHLSYTSYFYAYWTTSVLSILLGFAVIFEVFTYAIRPYIGLRDLATKLFQWVVLLMLLVSGLVALAGPGDGYNHAMMAILNLQRGVRLMQCGLLLFVFVFSNYLGLSWRNFACGIALGFGLFATTDLTLFTLRSFIGEQWNTVISMVSSAAYNMSTLVWFGYCFMPQSARARNQLVFQPVFDRWNQAVMSVTAENNGTAKFEPPAYLSEIEQTVEDIMKLRKNGSEK